LLLEDVVVFDCAVDCVSSEILAKQNKNSFIHQIKGTKDGNNGFLLLPSLSIVSMEDGKIVGC
jgi:hypothetical protein